MKEAGLEPGLILTFLERAFWVGAESGAGQPVWDFSSGL